MPDETEATSTQKITKMPRAVHELRTGKAATDVIEPGTVITDGIAKKHGLDDKALKALVATGAVDVTDVLTV